MNSFRPQLCIVFLVSILSLSSMPFAKAADGIESDHYYQIGRAFLSHDQAQWAMSNERFQSALDRADNPPAFVVPLEGGTYGVVVGPIESVFQKSNLCFQRGGWKPVCTRYYFEDVYQANEQPQLRSEVTNDVIGLPGAIEGLSTLNTPASPNIPIMQQQLPDNIIISDEVERSVVTMPKQSENAVVFNQPALEDPSLIFQKQKYTLAELTSLLIEDTMGKSYSLAVELPTNYQIQLRRDMKLSEALSLLRSALNEINADIYQRGELYVVGRLDPNAPPPGPVGSQTAIVFKLGNMPSDQFLPLADSILGRGTISQFAGDSDYLIYKGPGPGTETYTKFQALNNQFGVGVGAVEIIYLRQIDPVSAIADLRSLMSVTDADQSVQLIALEAQSGILVSANSREVIDRIASLLGELDSRSSGSGLGVFSFYPESRSAVDVFNIALSLVQPPQGESDQIIENNAPIGPSKNFVERRRSELDRLEAALGVSARDQGIAPEPEIVMAETMPRPPRQVKSALSNYLENATVDRTRNRIVFYGTLEQYNGFKPILNALDAPIEQILIEATVLEVRLTDDLRYGVNYAFQDLFSNTSFGSLINVPSERSTVGQSNGFVLDVGDADFQAIISALEGETDVSVISSPSLLVSPGEVGRLRFGASVPILRQVAQQIDNRGANVGLIANQIDYVDTGVSLNIEAQNINNTVAKIDLLQSISEVINDRLGDIASPVINQRELETSALVRYGDTILIGGLIETGEEITKQGIPGLRRAPIIGGLFGSTVKNVARTEIILLLRPTLQTTSWQSATSNALIRKSFPAASREIDALSGRR